MSKPTLVDANNLPVSSEEAERGTAFELRSVFNLVTGRSTVALRIPGSDKAYYMLPAEARILGMQLICEAERAMGEAIFLRAAIEIHGMPPQEAATLCEQLGMGTRADHALEYEKALQAIQQAKAMQREATNGGSQPS